MHPGAEQPHFKTSLRSGCGHHTATSPLALNTNLRHDSNSTDDLNSPLFSPARLNYDDEDSGELASDEEEQLQRQPHISRFFSRNKKQQSAAIEPIPASARPVRPRHLTSLRAMKHHPNFSSLDATPRQSRPRIKKTKDIHKSSSVDNFPHHVSETSPTKQLIPTKSAAFLLSPTYAPDRISRLVPENIHMGEPLIRAKSLMNVRDASTDSTASLPASASLQPHGPPTPPPRRRKNMLRSSASAQNIYSPTSDAPLDSGVKLSPALRRVALQDSTTPIGGSFSAGDSGYTPSSSAYHTVHSGSHYSHIPPPRPPSPRFSRSHYGSVYHTIQHAGSFAEHDRSDRLRRTPSSYSLRNPAYPASWNKKLYGENSNSDESDSENLDAFVRYQHPSDMMAPHRSYYPYYPHHSPFDVNAAHKTIPQCISRPHSPLPSYMKHDKLYNKHSGAIPKHHRSSPVPVASQSPYEVGHHRYCGGGHTPLAALVSSSLNTCYSCSPPPSVGSPRMLCTCEQLGSVSGTLSFPPTSPPSFSLSITDCDSRPTSPLLFMFSPVSFAWFNPVCFLC